MTKQKIALTLFIIVSMLDIIGIVLKIPSLVFIFKPLILLSLLTLYAVSVSAINKIYVLALIFSFFGDVLLMFEGELYFIVGLVSFLLAHLFFIKIVVDQIKNATFLKVIYSIVPFLLLLLALLFLLKDHLNEMLIPVIIYGITITIFGVVSLLDYLNTKSKKSVLMLFGAVVFILSDSILAINKFYKSTEIFPILVMVTYIVAQFLIFKSVIQKRENFVDYKKVVS